MGEAAFTGSNQQRESNMRDKNPNALNGTRTTAACALKLCLGAGLAITASGCAAEVGDGSQTETIATMNGAFRGAHHEHAHGTHFYVPPPNPGAVQQVLSLIRDREFVDAVRIAEMTLTPQAVWIAGGTPIEVQSAVEHTMRRAGHRRVPVLVAYNLPFRDCAQYSAGGALDTEEYMAWIDAFAEGIGHHQAIVILEPDGLGIIPHNTTIYGDAEWCQPMVTDENGNSVPAPGANPEERFAQLNYALDAIRERAPNAAVYLDGTHSGWLGVGEAASRLDRAGIDRAQGFFLNVSNYRATTEVTQFGTWVSQCIAAATEGAEWARGHFDWCPSQYNPETGYSLDYSPEYAATVTAALQDMLGEAEPSTGFVIDTSRNGQGHWQPDADTNYPDAQDWCNPPGRGLGERPSANTDDPLLDAMLWVKIPGESDGSCNRGIEGSTTDPEWGGVVDPAAGEWFPEQALELVRLASPKLF